MNIYVKFHEEAEKNPELNDDARAWFTKDGTWRRRGHIYLEMVP